MVGMAGFEPTTARGQPRPVGRRGRRARGTLQPLVARPGTEVAPLLSAELARRDGCLWVRIAVIITGADSQFSGTYYIVGVTHKYAPGGSGGGGYKSMLRHRDHL